MRLTIIYTLITILFLAGCSTSKPQSTVTVFAAASLTDSFTEIARQFESQHPEVDVVLNFAGSQTLRLQLEQGAKADIFASANESHMQVLYQNDVVNKPILFTKNQLVVIVPVSNPAGLESLVDLAKPELKLILANPHVPAGRYAREVIEMLNSAPFANNSYTTQVLNNVVSEEDSVKGVVTKVQLGEADSGLVYISDITAAVAAGLKVIHIPPEFNIEAAYPIATTNHTTRPDWAVAFVDFVLTSSGQTVLAKHGFNPTQINAVGQNR